MGNLSKRLAQYGAMATAVMAGADANGQVVYTDVDPDVTLQVGDVFSLDFEPDTFQDLEVSNPSGLAGGNAALIFPSSGGALAGFTSGSYQYPLLMAQGDVIDAATGFTTTGVRGDLNYYGCAYSNSAWCGDVNDGYLGVRFVSLTTGTTHYGWVRLDTDVNGDNLITVKDFAFEATPDTAIQAGEGLSNSNFYLAPNGITCMCPNAAVGESGDPGDGITYTKRTRTDLQILLALNPNDPEISKSCTSGITDISNLFQNNGAFNKISAVGIRVMSQTCH